MGIKPIFRQGGKALDSVAMTGTEVVSNPLDLRSSVGYSYQVVWSGGAGSGADLISQVTNDPELAEENWVNLTTTDIDAASGNTLVNVERAMYQHVRFKFDPGSVTTGELDVFVCVKDL